MKRYLPHICIILGVICLICAIGYFANSYFFAKNIGETARGALSTVKAQLPPLKPQVPQERGNNQMASMNVDGLNVVGILEIRQFGVELAVLSKWQQQTSAYTPCRYAGSIYDSTLVIGASDKEGQLSCAKSLEPGVELRITDMEGGVYTYAVAAIHHAKTLESDKLQSKDYDLTVFVKDSATGEYLLIRCKTA